MTNRDYLRNLSDEKLAEFLKGNKICHCMRETCNDYDNCEKCIKKWLEMKRVLDVERGQIRYEAYRGCSWLILRANKKSNWCTILDKYGNVEKLAVGLVRTWDVEEENVNVDKFLERYLQTT